MASNNRSSEKNPKAGLSLTRRALLVGSSAILLPRIAFGQDAGKAPKSPKGQVVMGFTQEPTVFNPLMPRIEVDQGLHLALFNPLWRGEPDGSLVPELAEEVPSLENGGISADGLVWKIKLRKGVKWHDGAEFTAEDVKFTLDLINNPSFKAYFRQGHSLVRDITLNGPYEISWKMERAYAPYLSLLSWMFIVPKHALETAADPNTAPFNSAPIGTGPFKWGKRVAGEGVTVVANPDYFGEGPFVERVLYNYIPDLNLAYTQFKTGQLDYAGYYGIPAQYYKEALTLPDRKINVAESNQVEGFALNLGRPVFQDKAVRQAMYFGLNKKAIVDLVYYGLPKETDTYCPRTSWAFNPDLPKHVYDLKAGNDLLDKAGWVKGSDGVRAKDGLRLAFTAATVSGFPQREQVLQLAQQDWKKLGIDIQIKTMPAAVVFGEYYTQSQFDCLFLSTSYGQGADPDCFQRFSSTTIPIQGGIGANFYQYKNAEVDRLLLVGQATFKRDERKDAYQQIQKIIRDDLVILPICQPSPVEGTKAKLTGYRANPYYSANCWNINQWRWES